MATMSQVAPDDTRLNARHNTLFVRVLVLTHYYSQYSYKAGDHELVSVNT